MARVVPRLCVDGRMLGPEGTGVASYARTLVRALRDAGASPLILEEDGARRTRIGNWMAAARPWPRQVHAVGNRLLARDLFREAQVYFDMTGRLMPVRCPGPLGVMHWTYPVPLRLIGWRNLYTVHDAIPLAHPELTPIRASRHRRLLDRVIAAADRVVTVTEAARAEIIAATGCAPERIVARWQAVDVRASDRLPPLPEPLAAGNYLLFCGTVEPRKNLLRLIEAYRASGATMPLVIAGPDGWQSAPIDAAARATAGVIRLPYVDRALLLALIAGARALAFATLSEGFGLPAAEAMALGTPVLASNRGALAEVVGDAALTVPPENVGATAIALARLASDDALCSALASAGLARAAAFAPERYAEWLLALYAHHGA